MGAAGSPAFAAQSRNPRCDSNATPSAAPKECTHIRSGREAVTFGSFWRSEPAAALRGFANGPLLGLGELLVQRLERPDRQVHLAADLDHLGRIVDQQPRRHAADRPHVRGDVLADAAVAARRGLDEQAVART